MDERAFKLLAPDIIGLYMVPAYDSTLEYLGVYK